MSIRYGSFLLATVANVVPMYVPQNLVPSLSVPVSIMVVNTSVAAGMVLEVITPGSSAIMLVSPVLEVMLVLPG